MTGNIIGEPTEKYVVDQVKTRQKVYGKGFEKNSVRSTENLLYMNNRNAWIKMASSVSVTNADLRLPKGINNTQEFDGIDLAKKSILFNGLSSFNGSTLQQREGVNVGATAITNSYYNNSVYGLGGTQFGIQPMPGISSVSITNKNRGSIRTATVEITAFNRFQFEVIETLYLRLGFCMLIEWGWDKYYDNDGNLQKMKTSFVEDGFFNISNQDVVLETINAYKEQYQGNYDGFFGRVNNFNWEFENDGSYSISIKLTGLGDVIESFKINQTADQTLKDELAKISTKGNRLGYLEDEKSIIFTDKAKTKLGAELYKKLYNNKYFDTPEIGAPYFNLYKAVENSDFDKSDSKRQDKLDKRYCYYISFGELCKLIQENIIPDINKKETKQLSFDLTGPTVCSYTPNLISFDPKICITNMDDDLALNQGDIQKITHPIYTRYLKSFVNKIEGSSNKSSRSYTVEYDIKPSQGAIGPIERKELISYGEVDTMNNLYFPTQGSNEQAAIPGTFVSQTLNPNSFIEGDVMYGEIFNIYINYDAIFKSLKSNVDKKGSLTLFKFLQDICDKINSAFANIIDIEPIIKNDKVITFIDQKPVIGLTRKLGELLSKTIDRTAEIEVYGFNGTSYEGTFLKNISFNTKISPKLSNQLSIGATARGVAVGDDATGYSNWNRGLVDRFQKTISDPKSGTTTDTSTLTDGSPTTGSLGETYNGGDEIFSQIAKDKVAPAGTFDYLIETDISITTAKEQADGRIVYVESEKLKFEINSNGEIVGGIKAFDSIFNDKYGKEQSVKTRIAPITTRQSLRSYRGYTIIQDNKNEIEKAWIKGFADAYGVQLNEADIERTKKNGFFSKTTTSIAESGEDQIKADEIKRRKALSNTNYTAYLALMFGGQPEVTQEQELETGIKLKEVTVDQSQYFVLKDGEDLSENGKSSYKTYLNEWSAGIFGGGDSNSKSPSNQIGLIPVEFDMEMDGISGFRIYNKIDINQRFLPSNYGESLEFLVKGLNHKIDAGGWSTNLQTLSTSNLNAIPIKQNPSGKRVRQSKPLGVTNLTTPSSENYAGDPNLQPIKDLIAKQESNFNYSIANTGTKSPYTKLQLSTTKVDTLTINQILNEYSSTYTDKPPKERVFAAGRYQIIPKVLKQAVDNDVVKESDLYSSTTQEKLGNWLILKKRPKVGDYLSASNTGTKEDLEKAVDSLANEFASFPAIKYKGEEVGDVVSGNGNKAKYGGQGGNPSNSKIGVNSVVQALIDSRIKYSKSEPKFIPSYVKVNT